ncbi:hypothetical protein MPSEU_000942100 [Mayamaea pseudoterrestris]|nr:hypothetical protein MPSEU_000942100 [Mayamaea pseudoterrestris]
MSHDPRAYHDGNAKRQWPNVAYPTSIHSDFDAAPYRPVDSHSSATGGGYGGSSGHYHGLYSRQDDREMVQSTYTHQHPTAYGGQHYYSNPPHIQSQWAFHNTGAAVPTIFESSFPNINSAPCYTSTTSASIARLEPCNGFSTVREPRHFEADEHSGSTSTEASKHIRSTKRRASATGKRFAWTDCLHRSFVNAIFTTGLKHSLPVELIQSKHFTSLRHKVCPDDVQATLQKYRAHEADVQSLLQAAEGAYRTKRIRMSEQALSIKSSGDVDSLNADTQTAHGATHCHLTLLALTEDEEKSSLGLSLGSLMELLKTLEAKLIIQRAATKVQTSNDCESSSSKNESAFISSEANAQGPMNAPSAPAPSQSSINGPAKGSPQLANVPPMPRKGSISEIESFGVASLVEGMQNDEPLFSYL